MVQLEGLGKLKKSMTVSGLEPATFQLVAHHLNHLCYHVPHIFGYALKNIKQIPVLHKSLSTAEKSSSNLGSCYEEVLLYHRL
jgi:hypothetical protein